MRKELTDSDLGNDPVSGANVISELRGTINDSSFLKGIDCWNRLATQTARRLERQIGRPHSEFNQDCISQELLWQICRAMRRCSVRNDVGLATRVVRNRARDILRRARARCRRLDTKSLDRFGDSLTVDCRVGHRQHVADIGATIEQVGRTLPEMMRQVIATAYQSEKTAAAAMGISRRQLRKARSEVRVELQRRGLREFLTLKDGSSDAGAGIQWNEVT